MSQIKSARPSPAIVIAVLALIAAVAGTAIAAPVATTSKDKLSKAETKKVKKLIDKKLKNNPGEKGDKGDTGATGPSTGAAGGDLSGSYPNPSVVGGDADTANGVQPVNVNFTGATSSGETVFVNQGGIRIDAQCGATSRTEIDVIPTAANGTIHLLVVDQDGGLINAQTRDWDPGAPLLIDTNSSSPDRNLHMTIAYRGADGTTVSGELVLAQGAGAAQCVIGGTLFVG